MLSMSRLQAIRIQQKNVTADGLCLDAHAILPPETLVMGSVITQEGLARFSEIYPNPYILDCIRWDDIKVARTATAHNMSCIILEAEQVANLNPILPIPCIPVSSMRVELTTGSRVATEELSKRIRSGQIKVVAGDLAWIISESRA